MILEFDSFEHYAEHETTGRSGGVAISSAKVGRAILAQPCKTFGTYGPEEFTGELNDLAKEMGVSRSALVREFLAQGVKAAHANKRRAKKVFSRVAAFMHRRAP